MSTSVEVGAKPHAVVVDVGQAFLPRRHRPVSVGGARELLGKHLFEARPQRQDLKATRVGERRTGPVHEFSEPAGFVDDVGARLQVQVIGVGEHGLRADVGDRLGRHRLDSGFGSDRNESGRGNIAVRGGQHSGAGKRVGV